MLDVEVLGKLNEKIDAVNSMLEKSGFETRLRLSNSANGSYSLVMGCQEQLDYRTFQRVLVKDVTEESVELVLTVVSSILVFEGKCL